MTNGRPKAGRLRRTTAAVAGAVGIAAGGMIVGASPAHAYAVNVDCSAINPNLTGKILFIYPSNQTHSDAKLLGNCHEHFPDGTVDPAPATATLVDCDDIPDMAVFEGYMQGIQVTTPSGAVYTNCVVHVMYKKVYGG